MIRATTASQDQTQDNKTQDYRDFDTAQPELKLSKESNAEVIDQNNRDQGNSNEDPRIHLITCDPVLHDEREGCEIVRRDNNIFEPVIPAQAEAKSRIDKTMSIARKTRGQR